MVNQIEILIRQVYEKQVQTEQARRKQLQAHSIVVLRFADEKQAADAAAKLKTTVDPRKWICVGVDEAKVVSKGKLVCVVMDDENGDYYINNFKANA